MTKLGKGQDALGIVWPTVDKLNVINNLIRTLNELPNQFVICILTYHIYSMANPHHYITQRTARYYTDGPVTAEAKHFWITCHGFAQMAGEFIAEFEPLAKLGGKIVAPEALNRFYARGFDGKVAATWMTREDREAEIADYVAYLDGLYQQETNGLHPIAPKHILGFSQGATTVCRWVAARNPSFNHLWLCSGDLPHDLDWGAFVDAMQGKKLHLVIGTSDPLIPEDRKKSTMLKIEEHGLNYKLHEFDGAHVLNLGILESGVMERI